MGYGESLVLMALLISLVALSVDTMLPALPQIGAELNAGSANDVQLIITVFRAIRRAALLWPLVG